MNQWSGAAFTANAVVPRNSFKVTKGKVHSIRGEGLTQRLMVSLGTPNSYDATGTSGKINKHFFCSTCGSSIYTELEIMPELTCVKAGTLDNKETNLGGKIDVEFYVKDRPSYLPPLEGAKQEQMLG